MVIYPGAPSVQPRVPRSFFCRRSLPTVSSSPPSHFIYPTYLITACTRAACAEAEGKPCMFLTTHIFSSHRREEADGFSVSNPHTLIKVPRREGWEVAEDSSDCNCCWRRSGLTFNRLHQSPRLGREVINCRRGGGRRQVKLARRPTSTSFAEQDFSRGRKPKGGGASERAAGRKKSEGVGKEGEAYLR